MTLRISWREASARRLERQFLANSPAGGPRPPANGVEDVVAAMLGAHAQVPSAAEVAIGVRAAGVTRKDVRAALWEERSLVRTHGPRGTVHLLPADELPSPSGWRRRRVGRRACSGNWRLRERWRRCSSRAHGPGWWPETPLPRAPPRRVRPVPRVPVFELVIGEVTTGPHA
ncbi:DNA glycosylase AlkZ-like family protein [Streptomyces sp. 3214.6]|uniref:DNA glycosylase AlkZ-like family protein n=1 Tax=Streptomyces sp. 3214.6 TaxID=1882757 RepID=UPI0009A8C48D|nr:crosslink repair DNA glycosylase YcaQ family protein [Streptomyces sp. 3214.6]